MAANNEQVFAALRPFFRPKTFGDTSKQITWWAVCDCHQRSGFLPDRQTVLDAIQAACDENPAMLNDLEYEEVGPLLEYVYASEDRAKYRSSPLAQEALRIGKQLLCDRVTGELRQALRPEQGRAPTHDSELVTATAARMAAINAIGMIPPQPLVQTWQQLNERYPNPQRAPKLIDGLLREEEILMLVSGPKLRKSWTVMSLAMAVATGQSWLGRNVRQGKVLLIDAELSGREFNARRTRVASALKACTGALSDNLRFCLLRGRTGSSIRTDRQGHLLPATGTEPYTIADLERDVFAKIKYGEYAMIIVDPLYKLLPTGMSEIDDDGWRTIFQILDRIATRTGAAIVVIHHANKGKQRDKSITDVGSGSGVISRAPDTHAVLLRRDDAEQDDTRAVLRAVTRSFPPAPDTYLRLNASEDVSLWEVDPEGKEGTGGGNASKVVEFEMAASDFGRFASTKPELRDAIIGRAMAAGVSERKAKQLFAAALSVGVVVKAEGMRSYYCRPESIQDRLNQQLPEAHKTQSDPQPPAGGPVPTAP